MGIRPYAHCHSSTFFSMCAITGARKRGFAPARRAASASSTFRKITSNTVSGQSRMDASSTVSGRSWMERAGDECAAGGGGAAAAPGGWRFIRPFRSSAAMVRPMIFLSLDVVAAMLVRDSKRAAVSRCGSFGSSFGSSKYFYLKTSCGSSHGSSAPRSNIILHVVGSVKMGKVRSADRENETEKRAQEEGALEGFSA